MSDNALDVARKKIDAIDKQILELVNQRAEVAMDVAKAKREMSDDPVFYRPEREAQVLRKKREDYSGLLDPDDVVQIYRAIMTACLALQQRQRIAFLGPLGTFSHAAVRKQFGHGVELIPQDNFSDVFRVVSAGEAFYGVLPIENSSAGVVNAVVDLLIDSALQICGEVVLPVRQHFLRSANADPEINVIYSHQQSLGQCKQWLDEHYPHVERVATSSNAKAAMLAKADPHAAAIAGDLAAEHFSLERVHANIHDQQNNTTRFIIIGKQPVAASGHDKTSLVITTPHTPGALLELMQPFAEHDVNITLIESRPYQHQNWSYLFFIDIEGHRDDENVKQALAKIAEQPIMYNLLGSYPRSLA